MSRANFEFLGGQTNRRPRYPIYLLGLMFVSLIALGGVLAANINLNSGGNIEFGQGSAAVVACDDEIEMDVVPAFIDDGFVLE